MKGAKGIDNPAFVPSSPDTPRRSSASPSQIEISASPSDSQKERSQLQEPQEPQKYPEPQEPHQPPPLSETPSSSQERSGPLSLITLEEGPCGWRNFHPKCLQRCNTPQGYLLHYCLLALTQGIVVNGLVNISISTIEKRYEMKSSLTGLISSSYDISFCVLSLFVSFFGERGHKPRWLAFASFMIGLGALVFSLPQFFSGEYQLGSIFEDTCLATRNNTSCNPSTSLLSNYLYVFILGQLLLGVGGTPLYTLGTAFIDESVPTHKSSLYIGIGYAMSILGPAIGYVLGGQLLTVYIDAPMGKRTGITENDPRWLGAWWIGFLLAWVFAWSLIIPFSCFPKHLPGTAKIQAGKISQAHQNKSNSIQQVDENFGKSLKDFPAALKNLMRNTVFMCLVLSTTSEALVTTGFATFLPKFIENQFGVSSSFAATLGGAVLIPGAALGQILGGVFVSKFKLACKNAMKFSLCTSAVALVLSFVFVYAKCENGPFAGVSESYNGTGEMGNLTAPCNANCNCLRSYYYPLCGDGIQYFSPCFAGCINSVSERQPKIYNNCSCIEEKAKVTSAAESLGFGVKAGKCKTQCAYLPMFLGIFFITVIFTFMAGTPVTVSILRCVNNNQRSLALGIQFTFLRLLGTIPGPIIFGTVIDSTCILWDINECGVKGACWVYNNIKMAHMLVAISVTCKVVTIFFNGLAVFLYKPPSSGTDVSFQTQNSVVNTVSVECDRNKGENEG
ncbi:PREDICTED: solute carrier organic anion transporter family member 4C1-like [Chrysochloris asiatica]|uniref:Solute carrier organic anion transporter family member n=1 Tax=Chrysochloris asiatica TaxID=185453 RepID=A0A9B0TX45_CHRAS|nr:PREDICTED: solute carrier organic anion transporter family member 4C1-like [Chrysochloris asiatica]